MNAINYKSGKEKKDLQKQTKESLKKFIGKPIVHTEVKEEKTFVTKEELTFLLKNQNISILNYLI